MVWLSSEPVLLSQKYDSDEPPTDLKELKKLARITAKRGLLVIIFLSDSRTDVSLISSRLIRGTRSLILKKPNTAKTAARMSIK